MESKIPFYHLINMFFVGLMFIILNALIGSFNIIEILKNKIIIYNNISDYKTIFTVCVFATSYGIGVIINRIGSVIIEPILIKCKLILFDKDYVKYNVKKKEFNILKVLSREYALHRTNIALFVLLFIISLFYKTNLLVKIMFFIMIILSFLSCKKFSKKITEIMNSPVKNNESGVIH